MDDDDDIIIVVAAAPFYSEKSRKCKKEIMFFFRMLIVADICVYICSREIYNYIKYSTQQKCYWKIISPYGGRFICHKL